MTAGVVTHPDFQACLLARAARAHCIAITGDRSAVHQSNAINTLATPDLEDTFLITTVLTHHEIVVFIDCKKTNSLGLKKQSIDPLLLSIRYIHPPDQICET